MSEKAFKSGSIRPDNVNLPIAPEIIFSNHAGEHKDKIEKKQIKFLEKLHFLKPFLGEGEKILYVTTACSPMSTFEQYQAGWIIYLLKRSLLAFTNMRILHIPTTMRYAYRRSIAQVLYVDCESIDFSWGALTIKYRNGKTERFNYIPGTDKKKIKSITEKLLRTGMSGTQWGRVHLCPRCTKELTPGKFECPHCHLLFKNRSEALKNSIIYPGGGYFYTGHRFLGIFDAMTEFMLMALVTWSLISLIQGETDAVPRLVVFIIALVFEKIYSVYHANRFLSEYIPQDGVKS